MTKCVFFECEESLNGSWFCSGGRLAMKPDLIGPDVWNGRSNLQNVVAHVRDGRLVTGTTTPSLTIRLLLLPPSPLVLVLQRGLYMPEPCSRPPPSRTDTRPH